MLHHFSRSTIHNSNQLGPPSPYVDERRRFVKVSNWTSDCTVGHAQEHCASDWDKSEANLFGGDRLTDAYWLDDECHTEPIFPGRGKDRCWRDQGNPDINDRRQVRSVVNSEFTINVLNKLTHHASLLHGYQGDLYDT